MRIILPEALKVVVKTDGNGGRAGVRRRQITAVTEKTRNKTIADEDFILQL